MMAGMLIRHRGVAPSVDPTAFVAPTATLVGDVSIGPRARVMYGAVLDAEGSRVSVGEACVLAENAVLRATAVGDADRPVLLDDHVFVGPHATLLGCTLHRCVYLGTGTTVLHGATGAAGAVVAVGALVHARAEVPSQFFVPPHTLAVGTPARVLTPDQRDEVSGRHPPGGLRPRRLRRAGGLGGPDNPLRADRRGAGSRARRPPR
jgi:carbonic anhydrase/acetyltransferase-like protein (isoleucine patch superfamily)